MHNIPAHDGDNCIDWGLTSQDYSDFRPNYPNEFYQRLSDLDIGVAGQSILDLGTGVGFLTEAFARQGAHCTGVDISEGQIQQAKSRARQLRLTVDYRTCPAEQTGLPDNQFDVITASQCWLYFDKVKMIREVKRMLRPNGVLVLAHHCWLPRLDAIAAASEGLILKHNPKWSGGDWAGVIPEEPAWAVGEFSKPEIFVFDHHQPFNHESWRGRIRACRGVAAALAPDEVNRFDQEHAQLLTQITGDPFTVLHRVDCEIFKPLHMS